MKQMRESENPSSPGPNAVGDQNVERLLASAYQPESLDPEFVTRVHRRAAAAGAAVGAAEGNRPQSIASLDSRTPQRKTGRWIAIAGSTLLAIVALGYLVNRQADHYPDGDLIWIDGQPYAPVQSGSKDRSSALAPAPGAASRTDESPVLWHPVGHRILSPRQRPVGTPAEMTAVGERLETARGQRRRVQLPDQSVLYLNENTSVTIDNDRQVRVEAGEVFVEVAPPASDGRDPFVVLTPQRSVTAQGTRFAVTVDREGTAVAVTQGEVKISGVERLLRAGQQIRGDKLSPLPRASSVLHWTSDLMAQAESRLVPASDYGGGALVAVDPRGQEVKLSLRDYHIDVHIEDGFARTTIDQTYFNHESGRLEGTFYFPLPPDASISRLAMYVNGKLMEGGMAERDHARDVFETIKHRKLDPVLLEWIDGSTFKMRVFPLEGRQEKRIILSYTQRLEDHYGRTQYRFPAGHTMDTVRDWSVKLKIHQARGLEWNCPSHDLKAEPLADDLVLTASANDVAPDRDVVVTLVEDQPDSEGRSERSRFSASTHEGAEYLMLRFRPELPTVQRPQRRDWVFLVEADGSRDPLLARVQVDIVKSLLEQAERDDTFSIITTGTRVHALAAQQQPATPENIRSAIGFLEAMHLVGALDLEQALDAAGNFLRTAEHPVLVHLGGGFPILGERSNDRLLGRLTKEVPYVGVGVGKRWNRQFMAAAASQTGGYFTQINPDEVVKWRAFELLSTLNTPRLSNLRVEPDENQGEFLAIKDFVADGEEYCAVARLNPGQPTVKSVKVSGTIEGDTFQRTIPVELVEEDANYLPRIWAKLAIDDMLESDAEAHRAQIIELSKSMYVMSPFTSLLVLENDAMYEEYNVDRGRKDHWAIYPCPAEIKVVHEPLYGPVAESTAENAAEPTKRSVEEILRTLGIRSLELGNGTRVRLDWTPYSTVLLPTFAVTSVNTTVSVPDGGTVLLGGIKRTANGYEMGVSSINQLPYVNRLFRNQGIGQDANRLMMTVTPRIIIQEEEEELLLPIFVDPSVSLNFEQQDINGNGVSDFDPLMQLINQTISTDSWQELGGGKLQPFSSNLALVVTQAQQVHGQTINGQLPLDFSVLTTDSWEFRPLPQQMSGVNSSRLIDPIGINDWARLTQRRQRYASIDLAKTQDQNILAKLDTYGPFNYELQPLRAILDDLRVRFEIPTVINHLAIEASGIASDVAVTLDAGEQSIKLRSALKLLLEDLGLVFFVSDSLLQITTPEDMENRLAARIDDTNELLLLFQRTDSASLNPIETTVKPGDVESWARNSMQRMQLNLKQPDLLYFKVSTVESGRSTRRLVDFAPAMATSSADVLAVVEAEADLPTRPQRGEIDDRARELIESARRRPWQQLTIRDDEGREMLTLVIDGEGHFRMQRRTAQGLSEIVICDGATLRHLYPEIGLGTTRQMSRFHRAEWNQLAPWLLLPVEDLALGADLRLIGPRTVAIAPHAADDEDSETSAGTHVRQHLVFAEDGRLAERRLVELPSVKTIVRVLYAEDGTVRWLDGDGKQQNKCQVSLGMAEAPDLNPTLDDLVLLPMPGRSRDHLYKTAAAKSGETEAKGAEADALRSIASDNTQRAGDPAHWSEDAALRLLVATLSQNPAELRDVIGRRFFADGDRRIGFYTLLLSSGESWDVDERVRLGDDTTTLMNPLVDHPESLLAHYIDSRLRRTRFDRERATGLNDGGAESFILNLAEYQQLAAHWKLPLPPPEDAEQAPPGTGFFVWLCVALPGPSTRLHIAPPTAASVRQRPTSCADCRGAHRTGEVRRSELCGQVRAGTFTGRPR